MTTKVTYSKSDEGLGMSPAVAHSETVTLPWDPKREKAAKCKLGVGHESRGQKLPTHSGDPLALLCSCHLKAEGPELSPGSTVASHPANQQTSSGALGNEGGHCPAKGQKQASR